MSNPVEEQWLEQEAKRRGTSVTQLKMQMVMVGPGGRDVMQDIVEDNSPSLRRLRERERAKAAGQQVEWSKPAEPAPPKPRGSGWIEPKPLGPLPGAKTIDHMLDVAEARDRRALAQELGVPEPEYVSRMIGPLRGQEKPHQVQGRRADEEKPAVPDEPVPPSKPGGFRRI
jgi:hypothetical protein